MKIRAVFEAFLQRMEGKEVWLDGEEPVSMVLLLRKARVVSLEEWRVAAERAFGEYFAGEETARNFVIQAGPFAVMQADVHALSLSQDMLPYGGRASRGFAAGLPKAQQRRAWAEHNGWVAVRYSGNVCRLEVEYAAVARLCAELVNGNCVGVYLPRELVFMPNDEELGRYLRRVGDPAALRAA